MENVQPVIDFIMWLYNNYAALIGAIVVAINALIAVALIIPGDHPDKELKAIVEFITKFSRK